MDDDLGFGSPGPAPTKVTWPGAVAAGRWLRASNMGSVRLLKFVLDIRTFSLFAARGA
jgi:hypothetical protein